MTSKPKPEKPDPPRKTTKCTCPYQKDKDECHPDCLMFKALKEDKPMEMNNDADHAKT